MSNSQNNKQALQVLGKNETPNATNSLARQVIELCKQALPAVDDKDKFVIKVTKAGVEATVTTEQGTQRFEETPAYVEMSASPQNASREDKVASAQALRDKGLTQTEVAKRIGRSQAWVAMNTEKPKHR